MKKILTSLALIGLVAAGTGAIAAEEAHNAAAPTHFPINEPKEMSWSFTGPFGTYDKAQLQRGLKVYKEVCSACHSMNLVAFRTLSDLGYSEAQIKTLSAEYTIHDGPNDAGEMFDQAARKVLLLGPTADQQKQGEPVPSGLTGDALELVVGGVAHQAARPSKTSAQTSSAVTSSRRMLMWPLSLTQRSASGLFFAR